MRLSPRYAGPVVLSIDGAADDQAVVVSRQRRRLESLLTELGDDEWVAASRCDGWTVQDVVAHLVSVNDFWELSVVSGLAGTPTQVLAAFDPAAHPPLLIEPMRALSPKETLDKFVTSNDGFLDALDGLDDDGWSMLAESPIGHVPIRVLAAHAVWDSWVHERDIALPLGRTPVLEPDEVVSRLRYAAAAGPTLTVGRSDTFLGALAVHATDPEVCFTLEIDESVALHDGISDSGIPCLRGPAVELIEALSIRAPLPSGAPDEWRVVADGLATTFDVGPGSGD